MTKELYGALSRAFTNSHMPTHAVGITADDKVYVVARVYGSYCPNMTPQNYGYEGTIIGELIDCGGYCAVKPLKAFHSVSNARKAFEEMANAQGMKCANNAKELKRLLKAVRVEESLIVA